MNTFHPTTESLTNPIEPCKTRTLSQLISERRNLISLWDLVEFMKNFDIKGLCDLLLRFGYYEGTVGPKQDIPGSIPYEHSSQDTMVETAIKFCMALNLAASTGAALRIENAIRRASVADDTRAYLTNAISTRVISLPMSQRS